MRLAFWRDPRQELEEVKAVESTDIFDYKRFQEAIDIAVRARQTHEEKIREACRELYMMYRATGTIANAPFGAELYPGNEAAMDNIYQEACDLIEAIEKRIQRDSYPFAADATMNEGGAR